VAVVKLGVRFTPYALVGILILALGQTPVSPVRAVGKSRSIPGLLDAGPLAVGPSGALYVAENYGDQVFRLFPDGHLRPVAGDGRPGFSGDGGPATRAELSEVNAIAFGPNGLYIADGGRVRVVGPNGIIRTIAGNGSPEGPISTGTAALAAPLHTVNSIAFDSSGTLYIGTAVQLLELTANGTLVDVPIEPVNLPSGNPPVVDLGVGQMAVDTAGDIVFSSDLLGWSVWERHPDGESFYLGYARRSGGNVAAVAATPDGAVAADSGGTIYVATTGQLVPSYSFSNNGFYLTYFTYGPDGTLYADDIGGTTAFEQVQTIVSVKNGVTKVLWHHRNSNLKDPVLIT